MKILDETPLKLTLESKVLFGLLGCTTYVLDKTTGKLTIASKGLIGNKQQEHSLGQITDAVIEESARGMEEMNDATARTYRIKLLRKDGTSIPLTSMYSSGKKSKEKLSEKIRQFLLSGPNASAMAPPLPV